MGGQGPVWSRPLLGSPRRQGCREAARPGLGTETQLQVDTWVQREEQDWPARVGVGEGTPALPTASHFQKVRPAGYSTALGSGSSFHRSPHCSPGAPEVAWGQPWGSGILCRGPEW